MTIWDDYLRLSEGGASETDLLPLLHEVLDNDPSHSWARVRLSESLEPADAKRVLEEGLVSARDKVPVHVALAHLAIAADAPGAAEVHWTEVLALDPENRFAPEGLFDAVFQDRGAVEAVTKTLDQFVVSELSPALVKRIAEALFWLGDPLRSSEVLLERFGESSGDAEVVELIARSAAGAKDRLWAEAGPAADARVGNAQATAPSAFRRFGARQPVVMAAIQRYRTNAGDAELLDLIGALVEIDWCRSARQLVDRHLSGTDNPSKVLMFAAAAVCSAELDLDGAVVWLQRISDKDRSAQTLGKLARAQLIAGQRSEAIDTTRQLMFRGLDGSVVERAIEQLERLRSSSNSHPGDLTTYRSAMGTLHESVEYNQLELVKHLPADDRFCGTQRRMVELRDDPEASVEVGRRAVDEGIGQVRYDRMVAAFFRLLADSQLRLGHVSEAVSSLRASLPYSIYEHGTYQRYRRLYRRMVDAPDSSFDGKTVVLIQSCAPRLWAARLLAEQIRAAGVSDVLIVIGDPKLQRPSAVDGLLTVPVADDYSSCPAKMAAAFEYLVEMTSCSGVFKLDDDSFIVDPVMFRRGMERVDVWRHDYCGVVRLFGDPTYCLGKSGVTADALEPAAHSFTLLCAGLGYGVSRRAMQDLVATVRHYPQYLSRSVLEDVMVGEVLAANGIEPSPLPVESMFGYKVNSFEVEDAAALWE